MVCYRCETKNQSGKKQKFSPQMGIFKAILKLIHVSGEEGRRVDGREYSMCDESVSKSWEGIQVTQKKVWAISWRKGQGSLNHGKENQENQ